MRRRNTLSAALAAALLLAGLTACGGEKGGSPSGEAAMRQVFAMDTVMDFLAYGQEGETAVRAAEQEVYRLESLLSRTREGSAVFRLNGSSGEAVEAGEELCGLIQRARGFSDATGGAFDITLAPISSAWGFTESEYRVPSREELEALLPYVGMEHVHVLEGDDGLSTQAVLDPGTQIDFGGIAKGYASDRAAEIYREHGISSGYANLGGNVWCTGENPESGAAWVIGIQDPADAAGVAGLLEMDGGYAVTSGAYQRYFEEGGQVYHHIIDPATGAPAQSGLTSITVVAEDEVGNGTMCDALSTALFVMGEEKALDFWRSGTYDFDLVLITEDGRMVATSGIADCFRPEEGAGYDYETVS